MTRYDEQLTKAISDIRQAFARTQSRNLRPGGDRGFLLARASQTPASASNFDLMTWLVVKSNQQTVKEKTR